MPDELRGQSFGLLSAGMMGGQGVGPIVLGGLAALAGPGSAVAVAGGGCVLVAIALRGTLTGAPDHPQEDEPLTNS